MIKHHSKREQTLGPCLYLSDTSLNVADNYCNTLGLILPPAGRSILALFDPFMQINGHPLLLSSDEELVDLTLQLPLAFFLSP